MGILKTFKIFLMSFALCFASTLPLVAGADDEVENDDDVVVIVDPEEPDYGEDEPATEEGLKTEILSLEGIDDASEYFSMNHLTSLIMGFVAAGMIKSCNKITIDMIAAAAGGAAFLYAEYSATEAYDRFSEDKEIEYQVNSEMGNIVDNEQKDALIELRDNYMEVLEILHDKKGWQEFAQTMLQSAMTGAALQVAMEKVGVRLCESLGKIQMSCPGACQAQCGPAIAAANAQDAKRQTPSPSQSDNAEQEANSGIISACGACTMVANMVRTSTAACSSTPAAETEGHFKDALALIAAADVSERELAMAASNERNYTPSMATFAEWAMESMFPSAHADMGFFERIVAGPGAGAAIALLMANWVSLEKFFGTPFKRMIAYGVMYFGVGQGIAQTEEDIASVEENIEKINAVLARFDGIESSGGMDLGDIGGPGTGGQQLIGIDGNPLLDIDARPGGEIVQVDDDFPCFTGEGDQGKCRSFSESVRNVEIPEGIGMDGAFGDTLAGGVSVMDDLNSGNIDRGTLEQRDGINAMSNAIRDAKRDAFDELDPKDRAELNRSLASLRDKMAEELESSHRQVYQDHNTSPSQLLSSLGMTSSPERKEEEVAEEKVDDRMVPGAGSSSSATASTKGDREEDKIPDFKLDSDEYANYDEMLTPDQIAGLGEGEEYDANEISNRPETSIFQIISLRYLKSGYERLRSSRSSEEAAH